MTRDAESNPTDEASALTARAFSPRQTQRKRLRGWLIAAGLADPASAKRLAACLLTDDDDSGVGGWIERAEAWLRSEKCTTSHERAAALVRLAEHEDPGLVLRAAPTSLQSARDVIDEWEANRIPLLPPTLPREMKRQPLGRLPAVLRGGAWILSARWASPKRVGPRIPRSLWSWRHAAPATAPPADDPPA